MEKIEKLDLLAIVTDVDQTETPGRVIFTRFDPVFILFTWTGFHHLTFVGFNRISPLESLTPLSGSYPGAWQYLAVIAPGASAADVIAEIELIAGVGPVKI